METITNKNIIAWLTSTASEYADKEAILSDLDLQIGDGDHGANMNRGFRAVVDKIKDLETDSIGSILKTTAMTLISTVGGASGPLYGSFFLKASMAVGDKKELTKTELGEMLSIGLTAIVDRGKAELKDKTMVDALHPAVEAFTKSDNNNLKLALDNLAKGAREGAESTIPLIAKKGRASYLGERSRDHKDPGSESMAILMEQLSLSLK